MRSRAIWRTDNLQFLGSWKVCGEQEREGYFAYEAGHPHVHGGAICMGREDYRASSVADALFLAFNPLSTYFQNTEELSTEDVIKAWFADRFDHRCGAEAVKAMDGVDLRHVVAPEDGCHCQHCRQHQGEVHCPREACGEWYTLRVGHGGYRCDTCDSRRYYCVEHKHEHHRCVDCDDTYDLYNIDLDGLDPDPPIRQCGECGEWVCEECLGEAEDSSPAHDCVSRDAMDSDEDAEHEGCDCDRCCECGADNS